MHLLDTLGLAFRTVKSNKLRTGITVAIIAFGIMALVGINTAIDAMKQKFMESFSAMGANGFTIHYREWQMNFKRNDVEKKKKGEKVLKKSNTGKPITRYQAEIFKERFAYPAKVAITPPCTIAPSVTLPAENGRRTCTRPGSAWARRRPSRSATGEPSSRAAMSSWAMSAAIMVLPAVRCHRPAGAHA